MNVFHWSYCAILPCQGLITIVLLVVAHQLKGERSGTQVPLHGSDRPIAIRKSDAVLGFLGDESRSQSPLMLRSNVQVGHVIFPYLCFFVIGMIPVVHRTFLQNKVSAIPNSESTDQLKHGLCRVRGFNSRREPTLLESGERDTETIRKITNICC